MDLHMSNKETLMIAIYSLAIVYLTARIGYFLST